MNPAQVVPLIVAIPLVTATFVVILGESVPRRLVDSIALVATLASVLAAAFVFVHTLHEPIVYWFGGWYPRNGVAIGISFYAEPISSALSVFTATLTLMGFVFSWHYFESAGALFHALLLVLCGAVSGFLLTADLFNLFVFLELSTVAAVALTGFQSGSPGPLQGAWNFGVIGTIGAVCLLTGVALIYGRTGALNFAQAGASISGNADPLVVIAFAFIVCGVLVKDGVVPFHFWLSDAFAVAATPACAIFSAILVEMGAVVILRLYFILFSTALGAHEAAVRGLLLGFAATTAVLGAVLCVLQFHLKRLLAFATVSHIGLVLLAAALFIPEAIAGAMLYVVAHGLVIAALFLCTGILRQRFDTVEESELHGKARGYYGLLAIWVLAALGLTGIAPFPTSRADALIHSAVEHHGFLWVAWIFDISAILTTGAILRSAASVFFGWGPADSEKGEKGKGAHEREAKGKGRHVEHIMLVPAALLVAFAIALTFAPGVESVPLRAATDLHDGTTIRDRILRNTHSPLHPADAEQLRRLHQEPVAKKYGLKTGGMNVGFAFLVAAVSLGRKRLRLAKSKVLRAPVRALHSIHNGAVGDYAAWLTAGVAVFTGALLLLWHAG
jgi:multicomponent Na+:H+ antiporter subunit D